MSPSSTALSRDVESLDTMAWWTRASSWRMAIAAATKMTRPPLPPQWRRRGEKSADADAVARIRIEPSIRLGRQRKRRPPHRREAVCTVVSRYVQTRSQRPSAGRSGGRNANICAAGTSRSSCSVFRSADGGRCRDCRDRPSEGASLQSRPHHSDRGRRREWPRGVPEAFALNGTIFVKSGGNILWAAVRSTLFDVVLASLRCMNTRIWLGANELQALQTELDWLTSEHVGMTNDSGDAHSDPR